MINLYNDYDNCSTVSEMLEYKGDIATITKVFELSNCYKINIDNQQWHWTDEMFEPVEEAIEYKGKKYDVYKEIDCDNNKFNKVLQLKEVKEEILDEEEKEYLNNVIKYVVEPTHNEVDTITKCHVDNIKNYNQPDYKSAWEELKESQSTNCAYVNLGEELEIRFEELETKYNLGGE